MKIFKVRKCSQFISTLIQNSYFGFLTTKTIYTGPLKKFCSLGLNCYSCPAALFSCPLGALQQVFISLRILPGEYLSKVLFYVLGQILLQSLLLGRFICGWLCPFGFLQDLLYKIPFYKRTFHLPFRAQRYLKHLFLLFFIILFPIIFLTELGYGLLWFCKYFCPAGTLQAGYFHLILEPSLSKKIGSIFFLKNLLLGGIILFCIIEIRFFCKNLCPLGLIYGFFNRFSLFKLRWEESKCNKCLLCEKACPMGLTIPKELNSLECIRCLNCVEICPTKAISLRTSFYYLPERDRINLKVEELRYAERRKSS